MSRLRNAPSLCRLHSSVQLQSNPPAPTPPIFVLTHTHTRQSSASVQLGIIYCRKICSASQSENVKKSGKKKGLWVFQLFPFSLHGDFRPAGELELRLQQLSEICQSHLSDAAASSSCFKVPLPRLYFPPQTAECQCFARTSHSLLSSFGRL